MDFNIFFGLVGGEFAARGFLCHFGLLGKGRGVEKEQAV